MSSGKDMRWRDSVMCRQKRTIADYSHRTPKMVQRKYGGGQIDRHRQHFYHGLHTTNVTKHLGCDPPSHSYSPALKNTPPPSFHRRSSSITENVLGAVHVKRFDPTLPDTWYNRQATDVTEQLRFVPPAHAMGSSKPDPWYGRSRTYVTNPDVDDYSTYQVKSSAVEEKKLSVQGEEASNGEHGAGNEEWNNEAEDQAESENWDWNGGHKLYYPQDGGEPYSQNWPQGEDVEEAQQPTAAGEEMEYANQEQEHIGEYYDGDQD